MVLKCTLPHIGTSAEKCKSFTACAAQAKSKKIGRNICLQDDGSIGICCKENTNKPSKVLWEKVERLLCAKYPLLKVMIILLFHKDKTQLNLDYVRNQSFSDNNFVEIVDCIFQPGVR